MFNLPKFEYSSFWIGVLTGLILAWILTRIRYLLPYLSTWIKNKAHNLHHTLAKSSENRLREDTIQHVQRLHLAASLFSFDEIIIEPRLMAPPLSVETDTEGTYQDITSDVLPYMPDWPELASCFGAPTLTLAEALFHGANIVVIGNPGSGKSTAMAYLACQLARKTVSHEANKDPIPLFINALDLPLTKEYKEVYEPLTSAMGAFASPLLIPRLNELVRSMLHLGRAVLILDGLDDRTKEEAEPILKWLKALLAQYPRLQVVTEALSDDYLGLNRLGFIPLAIASWDDRNTQLFNDRWSSLWKAHIAPINPGAYDRVDALLMAQWLKPKGKYPTPFEATLKAWGLFSGDLRTGDLPGMIESYIRRITSHTAKGYQALEQVAIHLILEEKSCISTDEFRSCIREYETLVPAAGRDVLVEKSDNDQHSESPVSRTKSGRTIPLVSSGSQLLTMFVNHRLLVLHANGLLQFSHPLFTTFIAGHAFARDGNLTSLMAQADWYGKWQSLGFSGSYADISGIIQELQSKTKDDILVREIFRMARWLPISPPKTSWHPELIRALATLVQRKHSTEGIAGRAVCAIGLSNEPAAGILFRQWLHSEEPNMRRWGAIGCGFLRDPKAVNELAPVTEDEFLKAGKSACLALAAIGNKAALESLVGTLRRAQEQIRRASAEALAKGDMESIRILIAGATDEDLMVRRSVVFGYLRSRLPALVELLEQMAIEDKEWIVRNAASHALEVIRQPSPYIPKLLPAVTDVPWLIHYAGKQGIGVQPGKPAQDLLISALENGDERDKLLALEYLRQHGGDFAVKSLYRIFHNNQGVLHQAAFDTIFSFAASGAFLPPPAQFGLQK